MNDPIKEFIEQNRAEFDALEAPAFNLERFKARLNPATEKKHKNFWAVTKWLVAASVLIALGVTFSLFTEKDSTSGKDKLVNKAKIHTKTESILPEANYPDAVKASRYFAKVQVLKKIKLQLKIVQQHNQAANLYAKLSDSSSSSNRLLAILDIEKSGLTNNDVLNRLAETLNHDKNSNVRLAALSVLEKYNYDTHAATLLVSSLSTQNDPMVQLALVNTLGKIKNLNINDKLYALANDPDTFHAVKDEAFSILLKEDQL